MPSPILALSRDFFHELVLPILERRFPAETARCAFGFFGYGSEALGFDDELSRDHHWGLRVDALCPEELPAARRVEMVAAVAAELPATFRGIPLRAAHLPGAGLSLDSLEGFLMRTLGAPHAPRTHLDWLRIPEEDILHVINGEVWRDGDGRFSAARALLNDYYPEPVRRRRIAHWCRYYSGMGAYALHRALLRDNVLYAHLALARALRLGIQLAFLLDRRYFPYDKWLYACFLRLPRMAAPLRPLVDEAVHAGCSWPRRLELLNAISDELDAALVADGVIAPHPRFQGSSTSGYRLLEHAYAELIQQAPPELQRVVPVWDQVYLEEFHCGYVAGLDLTEWDAILGLTPVDAPPAA